MAKEKENLNADTLDETLKQIQKLFGKGAVMRLGDRESVDVDAISSGSLLIDEALGVGGYPKGRIIEIFGPESSGKTTLALHAIAECQKNGGRAAFIDAEHAIDPVYAKNLGVDINELILSQPDNGEQALEIVEMLANSGGVNLIIVDSVAALVPQAELDGEMADSSVGIKYIEEVTSQTLLLTSSGMVMSNDLSPASTWPTAMCSLEATRAPARTALVSP